MVGFGLEGEFGLSGLAVRASLVVALWIAEGLVARYCKATAGQSPAGQPAAPSMLAVLFRWFIVVHAADNGVAVLLIFMLASQRHAGLALLYLACGLGLWGLTARCLLLSYRHAFGAGVA